jgi:hypothetical protein
MTLPAAPADGFSQAFCGILEVEFFFFTVLISVKASVSSLLTLASSDELCSCAMEELVWGRLGTGTASGEGNLGAEDADKDDGGTNGSEVMGCSCCWDGSAGNDGVDKGDCDRAVGWGWGEGSGRGNCACCFLACSYSWGIGRVLTDGLSISSVSSAPSGDSLLSLSFLVVRSGSGVGFRSGVSREGPNPRAVAPLVGAIDDGGSE